MPETPAVILLSGGLDSATTVAVARSQGFRSLHALSFRYGQRHATELAAAERVAAANNVTQHIVVEIDLGRLGGSALTSNAIDVPRDRDDSSGGGIPITYVPARNTVFLSYALAWAEVLGSFDIFVGVNAVDYSGYPDCRPEYIEAWQRMANLATRATVEGDTSLTVHAPLIHLRKSEIIRWGVDLGVDYSLTHSCYDPDANGVACGHCDSCILRRRGFAEAGLQDPIAYQD